MKLLYNSRIQGGQSNIYQKGNLCIKEYIGLTKEQVDNYLMLQSSFNGLAHSIRLDNIIEMDSKKISGIHLTFPHTNTEVFNMNGYPTTGTDFIIGKTLNDLLEDNPVESDFHNILMIHTKITEYIKKSRNFNMNSNHFFSQIHEMNVKIVNYDPKTEVLTLCITDIACTITEFLENNKGLIKEIIGR